MGLELDVHDCYCCGIPVHSDYPYCDGCIEDENGNRCDPSITWHCDGRNDHSCDGTGCEAYGDVNERTASEFENVYDHNPDN